MTDEEFLHFVDTVAAATMAQKAVLILSMAGLPVTRENAAMTYGRLINPNTPHFERLVTAVDAQICDMLDTAREFRSPTAGSA